MYIFSHIATNLSLTYFSVKHKTNINSDSYHIYLLINGSVTVNDNNSKYHMEQEDIILLRPFNNYLFESVTPNVMMDLKIPANFFESYIPSESTVLCNSTLGRKKNYNKLRSVLTDFIVTFQQQNNYLKLCSLIFKLFDTLNNDFLSAKSGTNDYSIESRIAKITNYIHANYAMPLNLSTLADYMFLSPQYLSKFIKEHFNTTFSKYLCNIRMEHAADELVKTTHSITTVAFNNGFSNTTTFNRLFKEVYNNTPTAYRKNYEDNIKAPEIKPGTATVQFENIKPFFNNKSSASYTINVTSGKPMNYPWAEIINVGLAETILSYNFQSSFSEFQKKIHFKYLRFQNIFSKKIFFPIQETDLYDFTFFDDMMDFIKNNDILPFIELGAKPPKVAYVIMDDFNTAHYHTEALSYRLKAFDNLLRHSINRYGLEYVSSWKFELWIGQDENLILYQTPESYLNEYLEFNKIIKKYLPVSHLGGPGFNTSGNIENLVNILYEFQKRKVTPSFISIYLYSYEPSLDTSQSNSNEVPFRIISHDSKRFKNVYSNVKGLVRQILPSTIPIYVTEFNSNVFANFIANSMFQASFICKNALDLLNDADGIAYWLFSDTSNNDFSERPKDSVSALGLVDIYGIKKPSCFAYEFLSRLGNTLVSQGSNYIMTSFNDLKYQILAYNYAHYNKYFSINCSETVEFQNTYSIFESIDNTQMTFNIDNLPPGRYSIRKYTLNRENGSFLDEYLRIFKFGNLTVDEIKYMMLNLQKTEVEYYKSICIPRQSVSYVDCDGSMKINVSLEPHEINFISITKRYS